MQDQNVYLMPQLIVRHINLSLLDADFDLSPMMYANLIGFIISIANLFAKEDSWPRKIFKAISLF